MIWNLLLLFVKFHLTSFCVITQRLIDLTQRVVSELEIE